MVNDRQAGMYHTKSPNECSRLAARPGTNAAAKAGPSVSDGLCATRRHQKKIVAAAASIRTSPGMPVSTSKCR